MDHVTKMEVVEATRDTRQLLTEIRMGGIHEEEITHESESIYTGVILDVFREGPTRHPTRGELEGVGSDTQEG